MKYIGNTAYKYSSGEVEIDFTSIPAEFSERACNAITRSDNPHFIEFLFNKITKDKYSIETLEAGIIINVIFSALKLSGAIKDPVDIATRIEKAREESGYSLYNSIYTSIIRVMPSYKLEDLHVKTTSELMELLVLSEKILGKEIFNTKKLRESFKAQTEPDNKPTRKGVAAVSEEDLKRLKNLLSLEEREGPGF